MLTTINNTMKAIRIHRSGGPEVLEYEGVPRPIAGPGEVLIRVYAAGVNPADWRGRAGFPDLPEHLRPTIPRPSTPGFDASGIVEAIGPGVTEFQEGDAVYGMIRFPLKGSTDAEYTTAPVTDLASKPATIDHLQAAAVPMAALTAWQQLFDHAHLEAGQRVLVNGAAGGVGHFAAQLALATIVQAYTGASDDEVIEATLMDRRRRDSSRRGARGRSRACVRLQPESRPRS